MDATKVPRHVACIMDGNGRWATARGLRRIDGHAEAGRALRDVIAAAHELGIPWLSVYAFSTETWKRSADEVDFLMRIDEWLLRTEVLELLERIDGRLIVVGDLDDPRVPETTREFLRSAELRTSGNSSINLCVMFNHGGHEQIVQAARSLVRDGVAPDDVTEAAVRRHLSPGGLPDVDLLVRTSGEQRISNFAVWLLSYAEFYFTDVLWPDFRGSDLRLAVEDYAHRSRRYGGVDRSVREPEGTANA